MTLRLPVATESWTDPAALRHRLHPLEAPPTGAAWNLDELGDLLPRDRLRVPAAVLVGLVPRPDGAHVLLTRRTEVLANHAGQVSFPGGRIDADDVDARAAALREAFEEVALPATQIEPLGYLDPYDTITGFRVLPLVAWLAPDYRAIPNPGEVAEAFEAPLAPLLAGRDIEQVAVEFQGRTRHYWEYRQGPHRIWGATAAMLVNLGRRLGARI
ncbi:MAG: CoA pyrophosphatase [Chiayiivirga sp.]|nr:CoA pyrophosphatase [Chiayiivirga sp.]MCI1710328.1 CoA pyrophosphatase [Chiayiivirga sp.]MCI1728892.1 CoA pyrophosphatase [Chiayiivirga sp.]